MNLHSSYTIHQVPYNVRFKILYIYIPTLGKSLSTKPEANKKDIFSIIANAVVERIIEKVLEELKRFLSKHRPFPFVHQQFLSV